MYYNFFTSHSDHESMTGEEFIFSPWTSLLRTHIKTYGKVSLVLLILVVDCSIVHNLFLLLLTPFRLPSLSIRAWTPRLRGGGALLQRIRCSWRIECQRIRLRAGPWTWQNRWGQCLHFRSPGSLVYEANICFVPWFIGLTRWRAGEVLPCKGWSQRGHYANTLTFLAC